MGELQARTEAILRRLVRRDAVSSLRKVLAKTRAEDVAAAMEHLTWTEQRRLFSLVEDSDYAAEVLTSLHDDGVREITKGMEVDDIISVLVCMEPDDATDVVALLSSQTRALVLEVLGDRDDATEVRNLLSWEGESAGGIMSPLVFKMPDTATCGQAITALQENHEEFETVFYLYVVTDAGALVGVASLRSIITHPARTLLTHIITKDIITVGPRQDQEEVARIVARYDLMAVPVVDENKRLLGIVTVDDVVDVIREEAAEDMMRMAGMDEDAHLANRSVFHQARNRFGWLLATIVGGIIAAEIIGSFEETLKSVAVLAGFIPVIMGMGGNVGIQSATVAVRGLATGHIQIAGALPFIWRESRIGIVLGVLYALILCGYGVMRYPDTPLIGVSIGTSILLAIGLASVLGASIPVFLDRIGIDPAIATGPIVTTAVDILGIIIYFNVAQYLLGL
jgi:magnesium transporter